jgi:hypothetical protein
LQCNIRTHRLDMAKKLQWMSVNQNIIFRVLLFIRDIIENESDPSKHRLVGPTVGTLMVKVGIELADFSLLADRP